MRTFHCHLNEAVVTTKYLMSSKMINIVLICSRCESICCDLHRWSLIVACSGFKPIILFVADVPVMVLLRFLGFSITALTPSPFTFLGYGVRLQSSSDHWSVPNEGMLGLAFFSSVHSAKLPKVMYVKFMKYHLDFGIHVRGFSKEVLSLILENHHDKQWTILL